jgi:hypothetical protein
MMRKETSFEVYALDRLKRLSCAVAVLVILVVTACSGGRGSSTDGSSLPKLPPFDVSPGRELTREEVRLTFEPSEKTPTGTIYGAAPWKGADEQYAQSIAEKFGVLGQAQRIGEDGSLLAKDSAGEVTVWHQNDFLFVSSLSQNTGAVTLAEDELLSIAKGYLSEHGVLPLNAVPGRTDKAGVAYFDNSLISPGFTSPSVMVVVRADGAVLQVRVRWPDLQSLGDYPLLSQKQAFASIFENPVLAIYKGLPLELDSVELFLQEERSANGQDVYVPFYWFRRPDDTSVSVSAVPAKYVEAQQP